MALSGRGLAAAFALYAFAAISSLPARAESTDHWEIKRIDDRFNDTYRCIGYLKNQEPRPQLYSSGSIWFGNMGRILYYQVRYNESPAHGRQVLFDQKYIELKPGKWQNDQRVRVVVVPEYGSGSYFFDIDVADALKALKAVRECRFSWLSPPVGR